MIAGAIDLMADEGFLWHLMAKPLWPVEDLVLRLNDLIAQDLAAAEAAAAS